MKRTLLITVLSFAAAAAVSAAEIHGTVTDNGKPVPKGTALKLDCGTTSASATTDEYGSYSLKTAATGDCRLTVEYKGSSASLQVAVFEKPSRYDLVVKEDGGKLTIARK
ncbi:MAG TPA: carboxypeptidase-like regulatory domain-containing protein [Thermoanaerobaculia bacterium]